jgi:hypothetical protein
MSSTFDSSSTQYKIITDNNSVAVSERGEREHVILIKISRKKHNTLLSSMSTGNRCIYMGIYS